MADDLKVDPTKMYEMAAQLRAKSNQIGEILDVLERKTATMRSGWAGETQQAYDRAHRDWESSATRMKHLLERTARVADGITESHVSLDVRGANKRFSS